jgi:hypothetical protein
MPAEAVEMVAAFEGSHNCYGSFDQGYEPYGQRNQPLFFISPTNSVEAPVNTTVLLLTHLTPMNGGTIHRCHRHTGNFSRPLVIFNSCKTFS